MLVRPREKGVEYDVDLRGETLFIHANDTHENFRLATAPLARPALAQDAWPTRSVRVVVPTAAGGALEIAGKAVVHSADPVIDQYRRKLSMVLF